MSLFPRQPPALLLCLLREHQHLDLQAFLSISLCSSQGFHPFSVLSLRPSRSLSDSSTHFILCKYFLQYRTAFLRRQTPLPARQTADLHRRMLYVLYSIVLHRVRYEHVSLKSYGRNPLICSVRLDWAAPLHAHLKKCLMRRTHAPFQP